MTKKKSPGRPPRPAPRSLINFDDCRIYFEQALSSPSGITLTCASPMQAQSLKWRLYGFRREERRNNEMIYPVTDAMHGRSIYDRLGVGVHKNIVVITHLREPKVTVLKNSGSIPEALREIDPHEIKTDFDPKPEAAEPTPHE